MSFLDQLPSTIPGPGAAPLPGSAGSTLGNVAETDPARFRRAELHVGDLVGGDQDPAAFGDREREHRMVALLQRGGQAPLYLVRRRIRLHHQLPRHGLDPDLDFHTVPRQCSLRGQPLMPRQASLAMSCSAASRGIWSLVLSQYLAVTCARPTIPTLTRWASSSSRPASCRTIWLIISAHSRWPRSIRSRTAASLLRSDSNTSRYAWPSLSMYSK